MLALREVTKWSGNTPNHCYLLDGGMLVAYAPCGEKPIFLKKRMRFNRSRREFVQIDERMFKAPKSKLVKVTGSRGNVYEIDPDAKTCTCPGFTYHGRCKHVEAL